MHPIRNLLALGQSTWLDYLHPDLVTSGRLRELITRDAVRGVTSNPTIFQKSIASTSAYDALIHSASPRDSDARIFERICVQEVRRACEAFADVHRETEGADGFVSIEVSPHLAHDTAGSIEEAERLWRAVARPNVLVKIPGTKEGLSAIHRCLAKGIHVNVTLLFAVERYLEVTDAYLGALEERIADGLPIDGLASIASFFVSRVDVKVDKALAALPDSTREASAPLRGQMAIANAKIAFAEYERVFAGDRWERLRAHGARRQRVLWASTSPKDPSIPRLHYAEELIAPNTVDTMTLETFRAYLDHGRLETRLTTGPDRARDRMRKSAELGLDFPKLMRELEDEGVKAFTTSYELALATIAEKRRHLRSA